MGLVLGSNDKCNTILNYKKKDKSLGSSSCTVVQDFMSHYVRLSFSE